MPLDVISMDLELARFNMIEQQIRPWGVTDSWVLELFEEMPRNLFVSSNQQALAFADLSLPIGKNEAMWQPKIEARVLQALAPRKTERVLEIGTGSGHFTALLARCSQHVTSVEIHPEFIEQANTRLLFNKINNIELIEGDGGLGWPSINQWDIIVLTGSVAYLPESYLETLAPNGRLIAIVGQEPIMEAQIYAHDNNGGWAINSLFETVIRPLTNSEQPSRFNF